MSSRERRRSPRAPASFVVRLSPDPETRPARLKDISEIGLCCQSEAPVEEMTAVRIYLELPDKASPHELEGAVVRCEAAGEDPGSYEVAVYFTRVSEDTRRALREYVETNLTA